jgi:hypothetical protein
VDNKNIAKNISFEKPDITSVPVLPEITAPELAPPIAQSEVPVDAPMAVNEAPVPVEPALVPLELTPAPAEPVQAPAADPAPVVQGQAQ